MSTPVTPYRSASSSYDQSDAFAPMSTALISSRHATHNGNHHSADLPSSHSPRYRKDKKQWSGKTVVARSLTFCYQLWTLHKWLLLYHVVLIAGLTYGNHYYTEHITELELSLTSLQSDHTTLTATHLAALDSHQQVVLQHQQSYQRVSTELDALKAQLIASNKETVQVQHQLLELQQAQAKLQHEQTTLLNQLHDMQQQFTKSTAEYQQQITDLATQLRSHQQAAEQLPPAQVQPEPPHTPSEWHVADSKTESDIADVEHAADCYIHCNMLQSPVSQHAVSADATSNCNCKDLLQQSAERFAVHQSIPQYTFAALPLLPVDSKSALLRRHAIREEAKHIYHCYELHAFGSDDLLPVSKQKRDNQWQMASTMIDALDTLLIMGLDTEFDRAVQWVDQHLVFDHQEDINLFETTIRIIGSMLSAYVLSGRQVLLDRSAQLADAMLIAFENTATGLPYSTVNLKTRTSFNPDWQRDSSTLSEVASIQLEWQTLSKLTGNSVYADRVNRVTDVLFDLHQPLYSQFISVTSGQLTDQQVSFGSRVDSIYEYLLKQAILNNSTDTTYKSLQMYIESMNAMQEQLLSYSTPSKLAYVAEMQRNGNDNPKSGKFDHLVCFLPGTLALGVYSNAITDPVMRDRHMQLATELTETCIQMYVRTATGLSPEIVQFTDDPNVDFVVDNGAAHSLLRPETLESLFYMYRITHNEYYRDVAWQIFTSFVRYTRVADCGYTSISDVRQAKSIKDGATHRDHLESFALAETWKYLYLMFSDDQLISLDKFVFNTEAHPLPIIAHTWPPAPPPPTQTPSTPPQPVAEQPPVADAQSAPQPVVAEQVIAQAAEPVRTDNEM